MKFIGLFIVCIIWVGCKEDLKIKYSVNKRKTELKDSFELIKESEKIFFLDSSTVPTSASIYYYEKEGNNYLTFYNKPSNSICFFDDSGNIAFKVHLEKTGQNDVGKVEGHYVHSLDSIFVFDQWNKKISLVNRNGKIINAFSVLRNAKKTSYLPAIMASTVNPWIYLEGKLFGSGFTLGEMDDENTRNRPVTISYDLSSRTSEYFVSYPDIYQDANWGGYNYRFTYSTFDDSNHLVLSFPADHHIYKANLHNRQIKKYYFGSRHADSIHSLDKKKKFRNKWFMNKYFGSNSSYSSIIYDKYRRVYYRVADLPIKDYNEDIESKSIKPFSIVILNSKMEWLGETLIPQLSHSRIAFYVSKEGLNLRKYEENEDRLTFSVFRLSPVKSNLANK